MTKNILHCSVFLCLACPACVIVRLAEPIRRSGVRREEQRRESSRAQRHKPLSSKETREINICTPPGKPFKYQLKLQWVVYARGCMRTSGQRDRRNGTAGQRMERADAPVPGGRFQRDNSGRMESEATPMPLWMHLHQR